MIGFAKQEPLALHPGPSSARGRIELTAREHEVLKCLAHDKTNLEMARILDCSPRTVAKHLQRIFAKLGVKNRIEAAAWWRNQRDQAPPSVR